MIKKCLYCGRDFKAKNKYSKYCSTKCVHNSQRQYDKSKICEYCGNSFIASRKEQRFCSKECSDSNRIGTSKYKNEFKICEYCGNKYSILTKAELETRRFCSPRCATLWRSKYNHSTFMNNMSDITKKKNALLLKQKWKEKEFRQNVINRMTNNNPSSSSIINLKANKTRKINNSVGFTNKNKIYRGGNGKMAPTEKLVYDFMSVMGFKYNEPITTKELRKLKPDKSYAYCYKPDFVHKHKKICVELDGNTHNSKIGRQLDKKKEEALNFYGYKTYHFKNIDVMEDLLTFKNSIVQLLGYNTLKVESVEEVDGKQFMYDIEVDGNHNYFANNLLVHNCKNIKSSQAQGILELDPKAHKVGMTGTLLVNNPLDLYCPMSFVGLINYSKWAFDNKYVLKDDWGRPIGFQNMEELHEILYKSSIRRTKDLLDLPPKIYKPEWLEFSPEEWKVMYDIMSFKYKGKYLDKIDPILDPIVMVTRMRQCTVAPELITSNKIPSTKFNRLNDILEEARLNGQKVLVFCPFTEALELGMEYCKEYQPKLIKGGMGSKIQETIDAHENTNGFSVIFAQEATLGVGFTLTNTEICVFLSPPWNKATYDQCSDRIHRIGQKKTVQIIDLYIAGTYDEDIHDKLHGKGAMADIVIDGKEGDELTEALSYINRMGITFNKKARETQKLF